MIREAAPRDMETLLDWRMEVLNHVFPGRDLSGLRAASRQYYQGSWAADILPVLPWRNLEILRESRRRKGPETGRSGSSAAAASACSRKCQVPTTRRAGAGT